MREVRNRKSLIYVMIMLAASLAALFVLLAGSEMIARGSAAGALRWMTAQPLPAAICYTLLITLFLFALALIGDMLWGLLAVALLLLLFVGLSRAKFGFLGEYLYPWDFMLFDQLVNLFPSLVKSTNAIILAGVILLCFAAPAALYLVKKRIPFLSLSLVKSARIALLAISLITIYSFTFQNAPIKQLYSHFAIANINWDQTANYKTNGFLLGFALNVQNAIVFAPQDYNEASIMEIVSGIDKTDGGSDRDAEPVEEAFLQERVQPNIIVVMNEAFWDPTLLGENLFESDPIPTVHAHQSGWLVSPQYGGGTANVEFEAITGLNMNFLPKGSVAYQQYVKKPIPSMVSLLTEQGYEPIAIHPYSRWFWERDEVYKHLGFTQFMAEEDFANAERRGKYIADAEVSKKIERVVETQTKPVFIYAVTMQNHGPYERERYGPSQVKLSDSVGTLTEETRDILETYTQGAMDADQALKLLMDDFRKPGAEPTVIAFFGDHLPFLGTGYSVYKELGFVPEGSGDSGWSLDHYKKMRSTPLVIWSNFAGDEEIANRRNPELPPLMTPSFLGPILFDYAGLEKPLFYTFLEKFAAEMPVYGTRLKVVEDGDGGILTEEILEEHKAMEEQYRMLQYDIMFGKQYGVETLFYSRAPQ